MSPVRQFTDGNLLNEVAKGNRDAIRALCADLAMRIERNGIHDEDVLPILHFIFQRIGKGESPNEAFGWDQSRKGNPKKHTVFRDWYVRLDVQERMMTTGESWKEACKNVSSENRGDICLSVKMIEKICSELTVDTPLPIPDNLFPLGDLSTLPKPETK